MNELVKKCPIFTDPESLWNLAQDSATKRHLLRALFMVHLTTRSVDVTQTIILWMVYGKWWIGMDVEGSVSGVFPEFSSRELGKQKDLLD